MLELLEIGPGAGASLAYYPKDIHWIGIEPNPYMHPYLEREAQQQGLTNIELQSGSAEKLPVEDESIDTVVSTHVLCSVTDLEASFQEIKRVLKPGGSFVWEQRDFVNFNPNTAIANKKIQYYFFK